MCRHEGDYRVKAGGYRGEAENARALGNRRAESTDRRAGALSGAAAQRPPVSRV